MFRPEPSAPLCSPQRTSGVVERVLHGVWQHAERFLRRGSAPAYNYPHCREETVPESRCCFGLQNLREIQRDIGIAAIIYPTNRKAQDAFATNNHRSLPESFKVKGVAFIYYSSGTGSPRERDDDRQADCSRLIVDVVTDLAEGHLNQRPHTGRGDNGG